MRRLLIMLLAVLLAETGWAAEYSSTIRFSGYSEARGTLTNFPALVTFTNGSPTGFLYSQMATTNGLDLRFYYGETELNYEMDRWTVEGKSYVWVQVPLLRNRTTITARWGDAAKTQQAYTTNGATWDSYFRAVYHLNDVPGSTNILDSTANNLTGYKGPTGPTETVGLAGMAQNFSTNRIKLPMDVSVSNQSLFTISGFFSPDDFESLNTILQENTPSYNSARAAIRTAVTTGGHQFYIRDGNPGTFQTLGSGVAAGLGTWHQQHGVYNANPDYQGFYVNGILVDAKTGAMAPITNAASSGISIGALQTALTTWGSFADGTIDEVRVSLGIVRSANWVWAEYQNMASNATFQTYGRVCCGSIPQYRNQLGICPEM